MTEEIETSTPKHNPLLDKLNKMPGVTFRLPSKGLLYKNGELATDVKDGEVVVYPMTTLDELYMKTPDMLFQGTAIEHVFKKRIPQIKKPMELFGNDVDFLLTALRKVSYGDFIPIKHRCTLCGEKTDEVHTYDIPLNYFLSKTKELSIGDKDNLTFTLSLGYKVTLRPSKLNEVLELYRFNNMQDTTQADELNTLMIKSLCSTIDNVDGIDDRAQIEEWILELPKGVVEEFQGKLEKVNNWGVEFKFEFDCIDCQGHQVINTVLNPLYFFILPSDQKTNQE